MTRRFSALCLTLTLVVLIGPAMCHGQAATGPDDSAVAPAGGDAVKPVGSRYVAPEPSVIPASWQLDIKVSKPTRFVYTPPGRTQPVYYWIVVYTVSNSSGKAQDFLPRISMITETLQVVDAQMAIAPDLFKMIKDITKAKFLEEPLQVTRVLSGADNARDSVAVFPLKQDPKWFRLFFCGFSGEQAKVKTPEGEATLEKVRTMEFNVPGNTPEGQVPPVELVGGSDKQVMRAMPPQARYEIDLTRIAKGLDAIYLVGPDGKPIDGGGNEPKVNNVPPSTQPADPQK